MTTRTAAVKGDGLNSAVTYKWLMVIVGPVATALLTVFLWMLAAAIEPVKQKSEANGKRQDRVEGRLERRLERIETKLDHLIMGKAMADGAVNVIALVKGIERFLFVFDVDSLPEVLRTFGEFASNPELALTWCDAAKLSQRVRALLRDDHE